MSFIQIFVKNLPLEAQEYKLLNVWNRIFISLLNNVHDLFNATKGLNTAIFLQNLYYGASIFRTTPNKTRIGFIIKSKNLLSAFSFSHCINDIHRLSFHKKKVTTRYSQNCSQAKKVSEFRSP